MIKNQDYVLKIYNNRFKENFFMIVLYQILIFSIIIIMSFKGFIALFLTVFFLSCFTIINIFTAALMAIQMHTILYATIIGAIIATLRIMVRLPMNFKKAKKNILNGIIEVKRSKNLKSIIFLRQLAIITVLRVLLGIACAVFVSMHRNGEKNISDFIAVGAFLGAIKIGSNIKDIGDESDKMYSHSMFRNILGVFVFILGYIIGYKLKI